MVIFHSYVNVYQGVNPCKSHSKSHETTIQQSFSCGFSHGFSFSYAITLRNTLKSPVRLESRPAPSELEKTAVGQTRGFDSVQLVQTTANSQRFLVLITMFAGVSWCFMVFMTLIPRVYGTQITIVTGANKPTNMSRQRRPCHMGLVSAFTALRLVHNFKANCKRLVISWLLSL